MLPKPEDRTLINPMTNTITKSMLGFQKTAVLALAATVALAPQIRSSQTTIRPPATPAWEAVSIKQCRENVSDTGQRGGEPGPPFRFSADRMTLRCLTVRTLIQSAYKTYVGDPRGLFSDEDVILLGAFPLTTPIEGGPPWIDSERYMIEAKAEGPVNRRVMQGPLLQAILENRFQLKTHRVSREAPIYVLTVAKGGPKLKRFQEGSCSVTPQLDINGVSEPPAPPQLPPGQKYCEWGGGVNGNEKQTHVEINAKGVRSTNSAKAFCTERKVSRSSTQRAFKEDSISISNLQ
jgi:hypothetical protein